MAASCTQGNDSALLAVSCPLTLSSQDTVELSLSCSATVFEKKGKFALVICGYIYIAMPVLNYLQYVPWLLLFFYRLPWAASEFAETRTPATRTLLCGLCFCGGQLLNMVGTAPGFKIFSCFTLTNDQSLTVFQMNRRRSDYCKVCSRSSG